ncbi:hypothetical protein DK419_15450 [Methylobacterium terrae]|uniref:Uncharacterized protein n=1 Tax=Methylobacterium terrae TaxID=2202827 RepID=A0A2U8WQ10_9HYPH|nr:AAA family ATPase [Methylobacterium terrae]AWN47530.1 hypothetical protein DK419_15450 [Methylobacterium terrae]
MNMHHPSGVQEAIAFLKLIDPIGRHHLDAFHPETNATEGRTFEPEAWDEIADWIRPRIGQRNLYFSVNEPKPGAPHKKLTKADIVAIRCVFVDADPHGDRDTARLELARRAEEVENGPLPATVSIDSGNGQQWFWKLGEKIGALTGGQWAEDQSRTLGRLFKGDAVQNIDRIMRLPGTVNLPTPKKLAKGLMGGMVRVTHSRGVTYTPETLAAYCAPTGPLERKETDAAVRTAMDDIDVDEAHSHGDFDALPDPLKARLVTAGARDGRLRGILDGTIDPPDDGSGSAWRAVLAAAMARHGFSAQDYANVVCAWPLGYPQHSGLDGLTLRVLSRDWGRCGAPASQDTTAERWFDGGAAPFSGEGGGLLFGISEPGQSRQEQIAWIDPTTWEGRAVVQREWEVDNLIPRREVTLLYGDGGIGKTLAAHQYATCAAAGVPWFGQNTRKARVMCFFCEDDADELHRRQVDINRSLGIEFGDLSDLRLVSRKHQDNFLMTLGRHGGELRLTEVWRQLLADAQGFGADVIILDTIADIFGGSEIDRVQVNYFVKTCLGGLAQGIGGSVMALGHPSQSGKIEGTSGSTAWNNAARSRLFLRYPKGVDRGDIRELEAKKLNYGPRGSLLKLRWKRGAFEVIGARMPAGATISVEVPRIDDTAEAAVAAAIMASPDERMSLARNSKYYAATVLRQRHPDLLEALTHNEVQEAVERLRQSGQLQETMIGRGEKSRSIKGLRILEALKVGHDREHSSIFS